MANTSTLNRKKSRESLKLVLTFSSSSSTSILFLNFFLSFSLHTSFSCLYFLSRFLHNSFSSSEIFLYFIRMDVFNFDLLRFQKNLTEILVVRKKKPKTFCATNFPHFFGDIASKSVKLAFLFRSFFSFVSLHKTFKSSTTSTFLRLFRFSEEKSVFFSFTFATQIPIAFFFFLQAP